MNLTLWPAWILLPPVPPCDCGAPVLPRPFQCLHQWEARMTQTPPFGARKCPRCKGSGYDPHTTVLRPCPDCKGTGYIPPKEKP